MYSRTPPVLETPRLILRGWQPRDLEPHAEMSADPEVMRYIGDGRVLDGGQSWREVAMHIGHWALRGYGQWALERKGDGASLGRAGLWNPPGWPGLEVGWKLAREAWGQGYATEAGEAAIEWTWATLDADRLISLIQSGNERSIRVAERLGMRREGETTVQGQLASVFAVERP
ncbi:MAG: GNAT family N-acetyltransferase [Solirubrobacterales bacterium]